MARERQRLAWVCKAKFADFAMPEADKPLMAMLRDVI